MLEKYEKSLVSRSEEQIIAAAEGLAEKKDYASAILSLESAISTGELQHREKADKLLKYYREEYENKIRDIRLDTENLPPEGKNIVDSY